MKQQIYNNNKIASNPMISFVVPTWNRFQMTIECFAQILNDERISEFVICDDCSTDGSYEQLRSFYEWNKKVRLYRNEENLDCFKNKKRAVELSSNEWVILGDSDNIFGKDYIDTIFDYFWDENVIMTPEFAAPHFDFRAYSGLVFGKKNISYYIDKPMVEVCLNAANYFFNKASWLETWDKMPETNPVTSDSIYVAYNWVKDGKGIFVTPNLTYTHRVHSQSHYKMNIALTPKNFHQNILEQLKELK